MKRPLYRVGVPIFVASVVGIVLWVNAGDLNPPAGPVVSTMKTLTEVEPRIALTQENTPGGSGETFRIVNGGSYYLVENLTGESGKHGILVVASDVTIDLNGFEMQGVAGSKDGITIQFGGTRNLTVKNGTIRDWGDNGIDTFNAVNAVNGRLEDLIVEGSANAGVVAGDNYTIIDCVISGNGGNGIGAGARCVLSNCSVVDNADAGIDAGEAATIANCTASENDIEGFLVGASSSLQNCTARNNVEAGFFARIGVTFQACTANSNGAAGYVTSTGCTLLDCSATQNLSGTGFALGASSTIRNCSATTNLAGISATAGSLIENCSVWSNTNDGITVSRDCRVVGNTCSDNGPGFNTGAGIHATGDRNRIENNHATGNDTGLDIDGQTCVVTGNTVAGNTSDGLNIEGRNQIVSGNTVLNNGDNYDILGANHQIEILLSEIPETIDWPATVTLAGTLAATGGVNGITVNADDVTIDLNGHALTSDAPGALATGILIQADDVTVRNGKLSRWDQGIRVADGNTRTQIAHVIVYGCTANGIRTGAMARIDDCIAEDNGAEGFQVGEGAVVTHCLARGNTFSGFDDVGSSPSQTYRGCVANANGGSGFGGGPGSVFTDCSASGNGLTGIAGFGRSVVRNCTAWDNGLNGISIGSRSTITNCSASTSGAVGIIGSGNSIVRNCTATGNALDGIQVGSRSTITHCAAAENIGDGIAPGSGSMVKDCNASANHENGIDVTTDCVVVGNLCNENGLTIDGAGIRASADGSRIENNNVVGNRRGIEAQSAIGSNLIIRNTARGSTGSGTPSANFDFNAVNDYGDINTNPGPDFFACFSENIVY